MQKTIPIVLFLVVSAGASAQIVKCRDAGGRMQFADRCPAGTIQMQEIDRQSSAPGAAVELKTWQQRETEFQARLSERNARAVKEERANAAVSGESIQCQRARSILDAIKQKTAFRAPGGMMSDPKERIYLDDSERVLFENDVKKYCKS